MMHLLFNRTTQWLFYILGKIILFGGGLFYILGSNNLFGQHCLFYVLGNIILLYQENRIFCLLVRYCGEWIRRLPGCQRFESFDIML